ncbi:hypothetical protein P153DRAFT_366679 [Dothidotthia symphoricarpi CBS 119687]|uniref:Uncharacterized protein n=1 Tax=Dothidotthia symphoricarpi CBS 119687 TaxID=1392245 RepID=A0A6A6AFT2_9PLEO|nr:uncharacterized protein P153DRAFT_366679 [Dothidotthia symphoricarpi CBS 119687]KAF2129261.1 hypothetical protein P153DRAFT_366679 [Dothidotthia symphoricarpi CBS 119687]
MSFLTKFRPLQRLAIPISARPLSTTHSVRSDNDKLMGDNPKSNFPDPSPNSSAAPNRKVRTEPQHNDQQSSASTEEHKTGDDHPAKQPDYQAEPSRKTGIGGGEEVKGGKEGLGERGDKQ